MNNEALERLAREYADNSNVSTNGGWAHMAQQGSHLAALKLVVPVLEDLYEGLMSYHGSNQHEQGCIGAYEGREFQCNCQIRDTSRLLEKHRETLTKLGIEI